ncbi:MAG: hypothetical protein KC547_00030 [Anaerolineae bacterium]|nr:hypothetical protein [Anaerolineae bacterium]
MKERLEKTLIAVASRYAKPLVPAGWQKPGDYPRALPELARSLASYNVLVLLGDLPVPYTGDAALHIKFWADTYERLYRRLARVLFPSFADCTCYYADQEWPPIIILHGAATPLIEALADFVAPFVVMRQSSAQISDVELRGLMDLVLEELEATDLPREEYVRLRDEAVAIVRDLLALNVRQMPLTPAKRPIFGVLPPPTAAAPAPPDTLPEETTQPSPPVEAEGEPDMPMFFEHKSRQKKNRPPLLDDPGQDKDGQ